MHFVSRRVPLLSLDGLLELHQPETVREGGADLLIKPQASVIGSVTILFGSQRSFFGSLKRWPWHGGRVSATEVSLDMPSTLAVAQTLIHVSVGGRDNDIAGVHHQATAGSWQACADAMLHWQQ